MLDSGERGTRESSQERCTRSKGPLKSNEEEKSGDEREELIGGLPLKSGARGMVGNSGGSVNPEVQFQRDTARAQAISREETPGCLPAEQVIQLGIKAAAKLGILCRRPNLPLVRNSFIPMDGNCIQSCCCHANDPTLRGESLKHAAWELRVRGVGTAVESLKDFTDDQWNVLQAIVTGNDKEILSKERIKLEMENYMESGKFSGNVGDILPQLAADFLNQPLLVIVIENGQVTNLNWIEPGGMFGGGNQPEGDPIVVLKQLQHFETLLVASEAKETVRMKYQQWKSSKRLGVSDDEIVAENFGDQGISSIDVARASERFEEFHQCNCGHRGSIASHLRSSHLCVQGIRDDLSIGAEMSDEVLIIQAALVLGGCPAPGCPGGNHAELPYLCLSWWKENGWNLMKWQRPTSDFDSVAIRERAKKFVVELTQGYEEQKQNTDKNKDDSKSDAGEKIQSSGNLKERSMEDPGNIFDPPIASTPVQRRIERQEGRNKPAVNVSKHQY